MKRINNIVAVFLLLVNILIQPIVSIQRVFAEDSEVGVETGEVYQNEVVVEEVIDVDQEVVDSEPDVPIEDNGNEETEPSDTEEKIEENVEETTEENVEETTEENVEETTEEDAEETTEEDAEETVEEEKQAVASIVSTNSSNVVDNLRTSSKARYSFVVNNTGAALTDAIVRVTIPANYLDTFASLDEYYPGQGYASKVNAYIQGGNLLIDYTLDNLGVDQSQTFNFAFKTLDNGSLPNNTSIPVKAEVIREGQVLAATAQTNYHYVTRQPQFRSQVTYPEETNSEDSDEDGEQRLTMIDFFFSMGEQGNGDGSGRSTINSIELYVKVPSGLQFDEQYNEGWVFDASTQTATYTFTPDSSIYDSELSLPTGLVLINSGEIVDEDLVVQAFYSFANGDYIEASSFSQTPVMFSERIQRLDDQIEYVIMTSGQITINPGRPDEQTLVAGENEINIKDSDTVSASYDFHITDEMIIVSGATYAFEIPEIMTEIMPEDSIINREIIDDNSGEIIGTWSLSGTTVTITFTGEIEKSDDRIFDIFFSGEFNDDLFEEGGEVVIIIPVVDQASATVILKPKQEDYEGEDWKKAAEPYILVGGEKVPTNKNPEFADWTVRVNDSMNSYESASFVDELGPNQEIVGDIQVYRLVRNYKNDIVDRVLVTGLTPVFDGSTFTVGLGEIEDAYEISYTTRLIRPDGGGNLQINNNARIILDGEGTNVNDSVQTEWSKDIPDLTKTGQVSSIDNNLIEWQIDYNFGRNNLGSSVTLTDVLSKGNVNIDSIKVIEVNTDIDGNVVGESIREVNVTKTPTDNGVEISGLDANGRAYRITFNSTVPFGMGVEGNNVIINNVTDDQGNEDDAEVTVDTTPDATKAGKATVDEDGNPYIEWTITLNSKKIDVSTISIKDYFDGRYLEPAKDFKLSKDGVEGATNFDITPVAPDGDRIGFGLTITDAGPHTYTLTYRTNYTDAGLNEEKLTNDAEVVFDDGDGIDIGVDVEKDIDAPEPGVSKTGKYVLTTDGQEVIEWVVTFNKAKIKLEKGSTLTDTFTTKNISLIPGELKVMADGLDVTDNEDVYSFEEQDYGFILTLNNDTNATFTLTFKTTADEFNKDQTNEATLSWRGKDSSDDDTVSKRDPGILKSSQVKVHEDGTKTIDWTIDFNTNRHVIYDFVLTDTNLPASVTIKDVKINGEALPNDLFAIDYPSGGIFTVTAKNALEAKPYQLTYTTTLSAVEEIDNPKNTAEITYRGGMDDDEEKISIPTLGVSKTATGIDKVADKTIKNDRINWVIEANTDTAKYLVNLVNPVLSDEIPEDQKLVHDSIKVEQYNSAKTELDDITSTLNIEQDDNSFSIELPNGAFQYRVTLQTEILFHPSVNEEKNVYTNTTTLSDDLHGSDSDTGKINYFSDGTNNDTDKQGAFNDDTENIDWSVTLNPQGLLIPNATIRDTLSGPHHYLQDSFIVTDDEGVPLDKATYELTIGDNSFELTFTSGELNHPLNITYSTRVDADHIGPYTATNKVELLGGKDEKGMEEDNGSVAGRQWTYGGGGSGRTLTFTVNKLNRLDEPVVGTTFKLTRVTSTGTPIPLDQVVTTGADGTFLFTNARAGRYIMEETSTPNSYELLGETIYFMAAYTSIEGVYDVIITDSNWAPISNELVSKDGNILTVINEFKTQEITATKNWLPASLGEDVQHPTVWLKLYRKAFGQPEEAVDVELKKISGNTATETVTWTGVETFTPEGERYEYSVKEVNAQGEPFVPTGYTKTETGLTVINTNIETVTIAGTKTWVDYYNAHGTRPKSIIVKLLQDGEEYSTKIVTPNQAGEWLYSFGNLPKYKTDGGVHVYEIEEIVPDGYEGTKDGYNLTNTYVNTEKINVSGEKVWDDWNDLLNKRPESVTVYLLQNGSPYLDENSEEMFVTVTSATDWKYTFSNLPKYDEEGILYRYSVTERQVDGYQEPVIKDYQITNKVINDATTEATVTKEWDDWYAHENGGNQLTARPESITVQLFQNDVAYGDEVTITNETWSHTFTELPKYDSDGVLYTYTVEEVAVNDYDTKVINGLNILNTYKNTETVNVTGEKVWVDYNNKFETRPSNIVVTLKRDGVQINSVIVYETDDWEFSFNNLPKYDDEGNAYDYTVDELLPLPYTKEIVEETDNEFTLTNTYINTDTVPIKGQKVWNDFNNKLDLRPISIDVNLYQRVGEDPADNVLIGTKTIGATEKWLYDFGLQPKYDTEGNEYVYTLTESLDSEDYISEITGTSVITNTYVNDDTVSVAGQKIWDDWSEGDYIENQQTPRPESVTINLFRNNVKVDSVVVTAADDWQYSFTDLPKLDEALNEYAYTIEESPVTGYETSYADNNITNTYLNTETLDLSGFKIWDDYNNKFDTRPASIKVNLLQDGTAIDSVTVSVNGAGVWAYEFTDLPRYDVDGREFVYSLQEDTVDKYNAPVFTTTDKGIDITNKYVNNGTTEATVTKEWDDWYAHENGGNQLTARPESITVQLFQNDVAYGDEVTITNETWSHTFTVLPKYDTLGELYQYTVEEIVVDNYSTAINGLTITNTYQNTETVDIPGTKVWVDYNNAHNTRPKEIAIYLYQNGQPYGSPQIVTDDGNEDNEWTFVFKDLPKYDANGNAFTYTFNEVATAPYVKSINETGRIITNTYINTEVTSLTGQKVWADFNDEYGERPDEITVNLFRNNVDQEISQVVTANPAGQWIYTFEGLDKYDENGKAYTYTVTEDAVDNYTTIIDNKGFVINTLDPQYTGIAGEKTWDDYNNKFNTRPSSITVNLFRGEELFVSQKVEPNQDGLWLYQFTDIPDRDENGEKYVYTVEEEVPEHYVATYDGYNIINTYVNEETIDIDGEKVWDDYNNKFDTRPDSILMVLYRNDSENAFKQVKPDAEDNWSFSFENLPVYDAEGNAYKYSVEEVTVRPYTSGKTEVDGKVVFTNTYVNNETTEFSGQKYWEDFNDEYGLRPTSIEIILNQNNTEYLRQTINEDRRGNWRYSFNNLPKYDENGEEYKYTVTDSIHGYEVEEYYNDLYNTLITTDVVGVKQWNDFNDKFGLRPTSIIVNLNQTIADSDESVILHSTEISAETNWNYAFNDVPAFDANGNEYIYSVSEEAVDGNPLGAFTVETELYNLINTLITTEVEVTKSWNDFEDEYGLRPETITINLLQNNELFDSVTVSADDDWSHIFTDIPKFDAAGVEYEYTVTENPVNAYSTEITAHTVTNTLIVQDITGTKVWNDFEDKFGLRPEAITVNLVQSIEGSEESTVFKTVELTAEDEWKFEFNNIPVYDANGNDYIYTLTEEVNEAYTPIINNDDYVITNDLKLIEYSGVKVWEDNDDQFGLRPEEITVRLYQALPGSVNKTEITSQVVNADNNWAFTFNELPLVNAEGVHYIYTVSEDTVNAYSTEINDSEITNTLITVPIAGQKVWNDYNNKFETRPETITVNLIQNNELFLTQAVKAAEDGSWNFSFGQVPQFDADGQEYVYTIAEEQVDEYNEPEINGTIITNTYINAELTSLSGEKLWDDFNNRLESRPGSITVLLLQNSDAYLEPQVVNPDENNKWIYSFTDLPKYDELGEAYEYSIEELAVEGYETTYGDNGQIINNLIPAISVSVGDYVWYDANKDGLQDDSDVPIEGVVLVIEDEDGNPVTDIEGLPVGPQVTDKNGYYLFDKLPADATYIVRIDQVASAEALKKYIPTQHEVGGDDSKDSSTWFAKSRHLIEDGEHDPTLDFGFILKKVSVGDYVWEDVNRDGLQDATDKPIAGVVLTIKTKDGKDVVDVNGQPVGPTTTDDKGWYTFENLPADETYVVTIDQAASSEGLKGLLPTKTLEGNDQSIDSSLWTETSKHLTEDEERDPTLDFGFIRKKVSVGDYVWEDVNRDGLQDATDKPIAGVVLTIKTKDGKDVVDVYGQPVGPTTTDDKGWYTFENLPADETYVVTIDQAASSEALKGLLPTKALEGNDQSIDSSLWTETSKHLTEDEERDPTLDFGFIRPSVSVGDYVWFDKDKDGIQDEGEPGIPGVVLEIVDEEGNSVTDIFGKPVGPVTTDENGKYLFENLPIDKTYTVRISPKDPALTNYIPTKNEVGDDKAVDSSTWESTSRHLTKDQEHDPTLDFGFYIPSGSVGDYVWFDKNKDGLQDETDIPLKGVVLTLEDEEGNPVKDIFGNLVQPQTTDENGFYIFENLPLGHRYTVRIDQAASADVLKDYETTLESQGNDISIDSSTWFATSVLLTEDGQHDPTLDFGFIAKSDDVEEPTSPGKPGQNLPNTGEESWFTYAVLILVFGTTLLFMGKKRKEDH